jgi:predicted S18 family serine protease
MEKPPFPKEKIYRLSDAFEGIDEKTINNDLISLDLMLRVININKEYNPELMRKSKTLEDYATLVAKIREYKKEKSLEEAIKSAVDYCLKKDILADYLKEKAQEVIKMLTHEYKLKDAIKFARKEGKEEGLDYALKLMAQGLSYEEIKKKIEKAKTSTKL